MVTPASVPPPVYLGVTTASLSCFASILIATGLMVRYETGLKKSPYSRIIFGLSIADIMQSAGILFSPFAAPSNSAWAKGTVETCEAAGFFLLIGATAVPFYTLFLSYYFLKRVKDKMTPQEFARKYEFKIHALVWLFPIIGGFVALARKDFNPSESGSLCIVMDDPLGCSADPDTTCIRGQNAPKDSVFLIAVPAALTFVILVVNLVRFTVFVYSVEKPMRQARNAGRYQDEDRRGSCWDSSFKSNCTFWCRSGSNQSTEQVTEDPQDQNSTRRQSLTMQAFVQSSLYICAYFTVYTGLILIYIMAATGKPRPEWLLWGVQVLYPLGGLFNILIYTRPKVSKFRRVNPQFINFPWIFIFLAVVLSGGEAPEIDEEPLSGDLSADMRNGELESNLNRGLQLESLTTRDVEKSGDTEEGNAAKPKPMRYGTPFYVTFAPELDTPIPKPAQFSTPFVTSAPK